LSFWLYDIFLSHWNEALRHINSANPPGKKEDTVERYVYAWLDAGAAVLLRDKPLWSRETQGTPDWDTLIKRLATNESETGTVTQAGSAAEPESVSQIAKQNNPRGYGAAQWLIRLAYFLWPAVSGIQETTAGLFFKDPGLRTFWQNNLSAIDQSVEDILTHSKEKGLEATNAEKLRKDWKQYLDVN
jgi:hypothetical protein